jgi:hypothetical protein
MYLYHVLFVTMNIYGIDCQKTMERVEKMTTHRVLTS